MPAGLLARFLAAVIDLAIVFCSIVAVSLLGHLLGVVIGEKTATVFSAVCAGLLFLLWEPLFISSRWQATPGKSMLALRVVGSDGRRINLEMQRIK